VPSGPHSPVDPPDPDTNELVSAVNAGDLGTFERLFREQYAPLCRFAARIIRDPAQAEDIVQTVFATLWAERHGWAVTHSARAYLFVAVRNAALNHARRLGVRREWEERATSHGADDVASPDRPDELLERDETTARIRDALAALPERCRMVMELRWREQLSYAEIAEVMGISVKGVENQLSRGLQRLRGVMR
jgi:RNA polymerase sigma-70 factor, ECF subfamily